MRLYDLYEQLDNEECAVYVLSDTDFEILYMNPKGEAFSSASGNANSLLTFLCGRKSICSVCPLNAELTDAETYVPKDALCSFANVSFSVFQADEGRVIISRWHDEEKTTEKEIGTETETENGKDKAKENSDILAASGLFEIDEALENLGSRDTLDSILLTYYKDGLDKSAVIKNAYEAKDYKRLRIEIHGLKSASYIVGLKAFGDRSKQFEYAGRAIEAADSEATGTYDSSGSTESAEASEFEACGMVFSSADRSSCMDFIESNLNEYLSSFNSILQLLKEYFSDSSEVSSDCGSESSSDLVSGADNNSSTYSGQVLTIDKNLIPDVVREKLVSASEALSVYDLDTAQSDLETALSLTESYNSNDNTLNSSDQQLTNILIAMINKTLECINSFDYDSASNILQQLI